MSVIEEFKKRLERRPAELRQQQVAAEEARQAATQQTVLEAERQRQVALEREQQRLAEARQNFLVLKLEREIGVQALLETLTTQISGALLVRQESEDGNVVSYEIILREFQGPVGRYHLWETRYRVSVNTSSELIGTESGMIKEGTEVSLFSDIDGVKIHYQHRGIELTSETRREAGFLGLFDVTEKFWRSKTVHFRSKYVPGETPTEQAQEIFVEGLVELYDAYLIRHEQIK